MRAVVDHNRFEYVAGDYANPDKYITALWNLVLHASTYHPKNRYERLRAFAEKNGRLTFDRRLTRHDGNSRAGRGRADWTIRLSAVRKNSEYARTRYGRFSLLAHEIGHCVMQHSGGEAPRYGLSFYEKELEAETFNILLALLSGMHEGRDLTVRQMYNYVKYEESRIIDPKFGADLQLVIDETLHVYRHVMCGDPYTTFIPRDRRSATPTPTPISHPWTNRRGKATRSY